MEAFYQPVACFIVPTCRVNKKIQLNQRVTKFRGFTKFATFIHFKHHRIKTHIPNAANEELDNGDRGPFSAARKSKGIPSSLVNKGKADLWPRRDRVE